MAQEIINYGASVNDGTGDPLRTAFIKTDNNFDQIWATGPVGSNITILNNTVSVVNTNGNLVLSPNGIGVIQTNSRVVPRIDNTYDLGAADQRYRSAYIGTGGLSVAGDLSADNVVITGGLDLTGDVVIDGNLTVNGNATYINVANLIVEDKNIVLANGSPNAAAANGGGITLDGANATITYSSIANRWEFNLGIFADGLTSTRSLAVQTNGFAWFMGGDVLTTPNGGTWYADTVGNDEYISSAFDGFITMSALYNTGNVASEIDLEHGQLRLNVNDTAGNAYVWQLGQAQIDGTVIPDTVFPGNTTSPGLTTSQSLAIRNNGFSWFMGGNIMTTPNGGSWFADTVGNDEYISSAFDGFITMSALYNTGNVGSELGLEHGQLRLNANDTAGNIYTWQFGQAQIDGTVVPDLVAPGNIIPNADTSYSLGNATNQWSDLWVSNATIYMNSVPVTLAAGNVLTVAGQPLLSNDSDTSITTTGNITADYFIGDGSQLTGLPEQYGNADVADYLPTYDGNILVDSVFGSGNLTLYSIGSADESQLSLSGSGVLLHSIADVDIQAAAGNVTIQTQGETPYEWTFGDNGTLTAPGNITAAGSVNSFGDLIGNTTFAAVPIRSLNLVGTNAVMKIARTTDSGDPAVELQALNPGNAAVLSYWDFFAEGDQDTFSLRRRTGGIEELALTASSTGVQFPTGNVEVNGNVTGGNLISNSSLYANVDLIVGDRANASASKGRFVSNSGFMYLQIGNGTAGSTGNIVFSPYQSSTARVTVDTASGNITAVGNVSAGNISTGGNITGNTAGYAIGYRDIPQVSFAGNATVATADAGKHFYSTESTNYTLTIANNASQGFQVGAAITVVNQGTGTITIAQGSGVTLYMAGNATPGNRTLSTFGMATIMKVATDTWFVNGTGVS